MGGVTGPSVKATLPTPPTPATHALGRWDSYTSRDISQSTGTKMASLSCTSIRLKEIAKPN